MNVSIDGMKIQEMKIPDKVSQILIVEDDLSMRELLEFILKKEGYAVTCSESGKKAISLLSRNPFDLLLCDIRLGDITGLDVLRAIKEKIPPP